MDNRRDHGSEGLPATRRSRGMTFNVAFNVRVVPRGAVFSLETKEDARRGFFCSGKARQ